MASAIFGYEKYTGRIESIEIDNRDTVACITTAEWSEWDNGNEAYLTATQLERFIEGIEKLLSIPSVSESTKPSFYPYIEVVFGDEKYTGRLTHLFHDQGLVEICEWHNWNNAEQAVITREQAVAILEQFKN